MIDENKVRESFSKIKEDMLFFQQEIMILKQEIEEIKRILLSSTPPAQARHTTHNTADNLMNYSLKQANFQSSIGNEGVPADRQHTYDRQITPLKRTPETASKRPEYSQEINQLSDILDTLRQDLGEKFKTLTNKEFLIFSVLYTLEEELEKVTYSDIAQRTGLTESSIRDYVVRLIHKGIPVIKEKINNKIIILKIPRELKDLATLDKLSKLKGL
ncbi:MAG: hypothetical protein IB618_03080 [Candidatus Pacearchaeota archaeon]|nr:MAG: hypothetical protein IB618_03080 [Candidatus Pacearchaeota archaeon]